MSADADLFTAQPHYSDRLRADFETLDFHPDNVLRARLAEDAAVLLGRLLAIEEHAAAKSEEDKDAGPDLLRIERKLDLVLELLSIRLMDGQVAQETTVQLSASGARWEVYGSVPAAGTPVIASIYVHRLLPRALRLAAEVLPDASGWLRLRFVPLGEVCEELMRRFVFQQHRRELAVSKRARPGG